MEPAALSRAPTYLEHAVLIRRPPVCLRTRAISGAPHSESWSVAWRFNSSYLGPKDHNGNVPSSLTAVTFSHTYDELSAT